MSNEFKGIPGGDPSRRPVERLTEVTCEICDGSFEVMWNGKRDISPICSEICRNRRRKNELVKALQENGIILDRMHYRAQHGLQSILDTCLLINALKNKNFVYRATGNTCKTCGEGFSYDSAYPINVRRAYCSLICTRNRRTESEGTLRKETLCPRPEKVKYDSFEATEAKLTSLEGAEDFKDKDAQSYHCVCGSWHYGSEQKKRDQDEEMGIFEVKRQEFERLLENNQHLLYTNGKRKFKKPRPKNTAAMRQVA